MGVFCIHVCLCAIRVQYSRRLDVDGIMGGSEPPHGGGGGAEN